MSHTNESVGAINPYRPPGAPVADAQSPEDAGKARTAGRKSASAGDRLLALMLMLGGVVGIGLSVFMGVKYLQVHWLYSILVAAFLLLFAWSALAGFRLWRGERRGWKWATILFAMQIPILTVPGLSYEYYTGMSFKVAGGHVDKPVTFALGSNANFYLDTRITDLVYGVNLFALAATCYLITRRRHYAVDGPAT
jgi:hypothetical protein